MRHSTRHRLRRHALLAGVGLLILAGCGPSGPPAVVIRNGSDGPLEVGEVLLEALKYDRRHPPRTLAPGESIRILLELRIGTGGTVRFPYVTEGQRYEGTYDVFTGPSSEVTIEIRSGRYARVGYRRGSEFRAGCLVRANRVNGEPGD